MTPGVGCGASRRGGIKLNQPAPYLHWAVILISVPNLLLILVMAVLFALALVLPFPGRSGRRVAYRQSDDDAQR